ncbi:replicative DNA helicase [Ohessyouella blattaphilus]|uniref:Replicative DNA helicase n=1 Tax=Ohessyouella blattaphilus TaxID=2949333 RepID=A0ABT1EHU7_9FIRM|nr:replicative DNA helicase [Ohessyouella blattaphilus]MCP1110283.1 replicative DNA helicase [Ohessyouella blattaphilus]MCR8563677.1 replicative DNA helicase [Ohessyouella blattaphilus]MDL2249439.1 replicative DNA helicase [Lachnospiraceae bacterium OttesenSCG-928-J05]
MEESVIKRIAPHSVEAEQAVIGSMIMDKDAISAAMDIIEGGEAFYHRPYGIIYDAMVELYNEGKPVDLVTLKDRLLEKELPEEITSLEYMKDLVLNVPTSANVKYYAKIVYEKAMLRKLIRTNEEIIDSCYANKEPLEVILEDTEKSVFNLVQKRSVADYRSIDTITIDVLNKIEEASKNTGSITGIPTGFTDLDYKLAGLQPSDLILIAARPSMGKTAFVLNIAQHVALRKKETVVFFSLEMADTQLVSRLLSLESHVDAGKIRTGNLRDNEWAQVIEGASNIGKSRIIVDETPGISITEMRSKCRKYKLDSDIKLIIIDYLQLMSGSSKGGGENRQQEISEISRSLKSLGRELGVPVIALSQLSRKVEERPDKRPMLSDLRESGAIEQDADVVMFIYRDDYYNKESEKKNQAEIIIAKQRNGPTGTVDLAWLPEYTKFANLSKVDN